MLTNLTRRVYAAWSNAGVPFSPRRMKLLVTNSTNAELALDIWQDTGACYSEAAVNWDEHAVPGYDAIRRYEYSDGSAIVAEGNFVDYGIHREHLNDPAVEDAVELAIELAMDDGRPVQPPGTPVEYAGVSALNLEELAYPAQD